MPPARSDAPDPPVTAAPHSSDRLALRIMMGLAVGLVGGLAVRGVLALQPAWTKGADWVSTEVLDPFGQIFLRLLFFVVIPIVFGSLALGVLQLGRLDRLGPLAARTFALFALNMAVGVALGLLMMNTLDPGAQLDRETQTKLLQQFHDSAQDIQTKTIGREGLSFATLVEMFMPRNLVKSVVEFQLLPLILFALLVGSAGTRLRDAERQTLLAGLEIVTDVMTGIVHFALRLAPYAVAALMASVVIKLGMEFLMALLLFVGGVLLVMAIHLFGTMSLLLKLLSRRKPADVFRAIRAILVTAFSTSSSSATLPTSIQVSRENLGISSSTAGFVLPLGATMNMSGTALYEGCVVLFVAQVYGLDLSLTKQLMLLLLAVSSAVAVAGIPGASLPLLVGLLANFGLPADGIALILGVDRLLDMARTVVNVGADVVTACIVDETVTHTLKTTEPS